MRKIPLLILSLFGLASNLVATPIFALSNNRISVSAVVLEHLTFRQLDGHIIVETNTDLPYIFVTNKERNTILVTLEY